MNYDIPQISVIMSVYNTFPEYLSASINSILKQTFTDFEFLITDDCGNLETRIQLEKYAKTDTRIHLIINQNNIGLTKSLNEMLRISKGKYIARMDADDISRPNRLQEQFDYMETHSQYAVIGCKFSSTRSYISFPFHWNDNMEIRRINLLFFNDGICHPTAFFRKSFLTDNQIEYNPQIKKSQDYSMWVSIAEMGGKIGLCPHNLFFYRIHPGQISSKNHEDQMIYEHIIIHNQLDRFDQNICDKDSNLLYHFYRGELLMKKRNCWQF